jgi:hypothetical protein
LQLTAASRVFGKLVVHCLHVRLQSREVRQHSTKHVREIRGRFVRLGTPRRVTTIAASTFYVHDTNLLARSGAIREASTAAYCAPAANGT